MASSPVPGRFFHATGVRTRRHSLTDRRQYCEDDYAHEVAAYQLLQPHGRNLTGRYPDMPRPLRRQPNHNGNHEQNGISPSTHDLSSSDSSNASTSSDGPPIKLPLVMRHVQRTGSTQLDPSVLPVVSEQTGHLFITTTGLTWRDLYQQVQCCALAKLFERLPQLQWSAAGINDIKGTVYLLTGGIRVPVRDDREEWPLVKPWLKLTDTVVLFEFETPALATVRQDRPAASATGPGWIQRQLSGVRTFFGIESRGEECVMELSTLADRSKDEEASTESKRDSAVVPAFEETS
ncbi:hypothetical protein Tdes44962_MAKER00200 [Teratosphaeria destructans]|uniref:Uncharacterized protein n=1 Tax=Teratosphaeria destructans TaxID=418781 RepID=A0A9W7SV13_9PEZI|nr:hypothetical protein Tdes44962_MAKER00200 [Teratosphaeria destructans]